MRRLDTLLGLALLLVATGCAGREFTRPQPDTLALGTTSEAEIRQRLGEPYREGTVIKNGETLRSLAYAHASGAASLVGGVTPARGQTFYFWDGALVGHEFTSSFEQDKTDFDVSRVQQIRKNNTTETEVIALLGRPQGAQIYPLIAEKGDRAIVYFYSQTRGSAFDLKFYQQLLIVTLDGQGRVKDSQFTSSGQR